MEIEGTPIPQDEALALVRKDRLSRVLQGDKDSPLRNMLDEAIRLLSEGAEEISDRQHSLDDYHPEWQHRLGATRRIARCSPHLRPRRSLRRGFFHRPC